MLPLLEQLGYSIGIGLALTHEHKCSSLFSHGVKALRTIVGYSWSVAFGQERKWNMFLDASLKSLN